MPKRKKNSPDDQQLIRRYLLWCYKTTREQLERVDRKYTQLTVDCFISDCLDQEVGNLSATGKKLYAAKVNEFKKYIKDKECLADGQKYLPKGRTAVAPEYWYLKVRLKGIQRAIRYFLGKKELKMIQGLYEEEMINRILQSRETT